ncbi:DMT family transporter [Cohnella sp. AR92]|uniref:DMT family transporter n=1 Tax=Cohnella sp. AR92 TaxID=648716 RepID=UPI000F8D3CE3|nr:DMT family transporter [Cohnella sp. AR92]RUS48995.1 DMT family transporter [Cohnella sp. AR92]
MMAGMAMALAAGALISVQTMFNNRVNEAASPGSTSALVLGMGFLASLAMGLLMEGTAFLSWGSMETWFWFSGLLGIGVVICNVRSVKLLGPGYAVSLIMASQLLSALWMDSLGWFGLEKVPFTLLKAAGAILLIGGLALFKARKPGAATEAEPAADVL